jgi:hypothetical protein
VAGVVLLSAIVKNIPIQILELISLFASSIVSGME